MLPLTITACEAEPPVTSGLEQGEILELQLPVDVVSSEPGDLTVEIGPLGAGSGPLLVAGNGVSVQPDRTSPEGIAVLLTASWPEPEDGVVYVQPPGLSVIYLPSGTQLPAGTRVIDRDWQAQAPRGVRLPNQPATVRVCLAVLEGEAVAEVLADHLQNGESDLTDATAPVGVFVGPSDHWNTYACSEPIVFP